MTVLPSDPRVSQGRMQSAQEVAGHGCLCYRGPQVREGQCKSPLKEKPINGRAVGHLSQGSVHQGGSRPLC